MTFQPLIHISPLMAILQVLMWTTVLTLGVLILSYILFYLPWKIFFYIPAKSGNEDKKKRMQKLLWFVTAAWAVLGFLFIAIGMDAQRYYANVNTASHNIIQKYEVEQVIFPPRPTGRNYKGDVYYPEQSAPQPLTVKVNGKSRMAFLTQDESTSEPTLLDVDSGKPMEDILRSQP